MIRLHQTLFAGVAAIALLPVAALAQDNAAADPDALNEIVVTAQKRSENLQSVPIAVTAVTGEFLGGLEKGTIESIAQETPGLSFSRAGGQSFIYLRGIGSDIQGWGSDPSVALNIDGAYVGRFELGASQFFDIDRVEVLRGPQGTLYGRNATGGVINILSRRPGEEFDARLRASYSSFNRREIEAAVGGSVDGEGKIGARLAMRYTKDNGFTDDLDPRGTNRIDDQDILGMRATIAVAPSDAVNITLIYDHTRSKNGNTSIRPLDNLGLAETLGAIPTRFGQTRNDLDTFDRWSTDGLTGTIDIELTPELSFTSITAKRWYDQRFLFNTDGTEIEITRTQFDRNYDSFSQEARLNWNSDRLRAVLGGFYLDEDNQGTLGLVRVGGAAAPGTFVFPSTNRTKSWAIFSDLTFNVTPELGIIAGLRYNEDKKEDRTLRGSIADTDGIFGTGTFVQNGSRNADNKWDSWTPRIGIEYKPNSDLLFYATASRGFKAGGMNSYDLNQPFDPETIWAYEGGAKTELFDRRLRLNVSVFHYDYKDLQVSTFLNGFTVVTNAASAKIDGIEIESALRAARGLTLTANVGYLDAKYQDFLSPFGVTSTGATNIIDVSGNRLRNAPEWKLSGAADYETEISGSLKLHATTQVSHTSRTFFSQFNENVASNGPLTLVDARIGIGDIDGKWEVAVFAKNLTDEEYLANVVRFTSTTDFAKDTSRIGNALGYPAPGRQIGVQMALDF
jgi:iron complex outermembrane receptor protein